jgi:hypothetical protein
MVAPGMKNYDGEAVASLAGPLRWAVDVSMGASVHIEQGRRQDQCRVQRRWRQRLRWSLGRLPFLSRIDGGGGGGKEERRVGAWAGGCGRDYRDCSVATGVFDGDLQCTNVVGECWSCSVCGTMVHN